MPSNGLVGNTQSLLQSLEGNFVKAAAFAASSLPEHSIDLRRNPAQGVLDMLLFHTCKVGNRCRHVNPGRA